MIIGYTSGVYDLFHVGHVNLLNKAKAMCDKLIVGVTTDELMITYKKKQAVIPYSERAEIISNIKAVDLVVPQNNMNKIEAWEKLKFNIMFVGDDWYNSNKWQTIEKEFLKKKVSVIYFAYTQGTSSTIINETLDKLRKN